MCRLDGEEDRLRRHVFTRVVCVCPVPTGAKRCLGQRLLLITLRGARGVFFPTIFRCSEITHFRDSTTTRAPSAYTYFPLPRIFCTYPFTLLISPRVRFPPLEERRKRWTGLHSSAIVFPKTILFQ